MGCRLTKKRAVALLSAISLATIRMANASPALQTLINFNGIGDGTDPVGGLTFDAAGNLYGATESGGSNGDGTIFELPVGNQQGITTLVNFNSGSGANPWGKLLVDPTGNIYGTTEMGGASNQGTVFELPSASPGTVSTLVSLNASSGVYPIRGMMMDARGNLYGTTYSGGGGYGSIFKLSGTNHQTLSRLASFGLAVDDTYINPEYPESELTEDAAGNIYGTGSMGGVNNVGGVCELEVANPSTLTTIASFNTSNGNMPLAGVTFDASGNLYGTTYTGGKYNDGAVYELSGPNFQNISTVFSFNNSTGVNPESELIVDAAGNLYGTTYRGGTYGDGTVFELSGTNDQTETVLFNFNGSDGSFPQAMLTPDAFGNLYGTTDSGGTNGDGTAFELTDTGFAVPEPSGLILLAVAGSIASARRQLRTGQLVGRR